MKVWLGPLILVFSLLTLASAQPPKPVASAAEEKAQALFAAGKFELALEELQTAVKQNPKLPPARVILAAYFFQSGNGREARLQLEAAAKDDTKHPDLYLLNAQFALNDGRATDALLNLAQAEQLSQDARWDAEARKRIQRDVKLFSATANEQRKDFAAAKLALEQVLASEPKNGTIRYRLGAVLYAMGQVDAAYEQFQQGYADDPASELPELRMANLSLPDIAKAEDWMKRGLAKHPTRTIMMQSYVGFLLDHKTPDEAEPILRQVEQVAPKDRSTRMLRGLYLRYKKDHAAAEPLFENLLKENPNDSPAAWNLALVLIESPDAGKKSRARELAENEVRRSPRLTEAHLIMGFIQYRLGRLDEAERSLVTATQLGPISRDGAYFFALVALDRQRDADAVKMLKAGMESRGPFIYKPEATKLLQSLEAKLNKQP